MKAHYHLIGIGGIGMGALAHLLVDQGQHVSGSDLRVNDITQGLESRGVTIYYSHHEQNIINADWISYSSAIKEDNPELREARTAGKVVLQRAELLAELMKGHKVISVAGAHGKTTTTSMISQLCIQGGLQPTTVLGGIVRDSKLHAKMGCSEYFVAEVDESDGSFLNFTPTISVITNIDLEHLDYYSGWKAIEDIYLRFILQTQQDGLNIYCGDDGRLSSLLEKTHTKKISYGFQSHNDLIAKDIIQTGWFTEFNVFKREEKIGAFRLKALGRHNVLNALATITVGLEVNISLEDIRLALEQYQNVKRRFDIKFDQDTIKVIDDYAHHPTEIKATIQTALQIKNKRLVTVFQPHRYTRLQALMDDFADSLALSDQLILTDIYAASEKPIEGVTIEELVNKVQALTQKQVDYVRKDDLADTLVNQCQRGDLILTLGAGDITNISDEIATGLKLRFTMHSSVSVNEV